MNGEEQLPGLPSITLDIRRALGESGTSMASLSKLIARDPSLTTILLKYAPSVMLHTHMPPQTLFDVIRVLGMAQVERITMVHSVKSLFTLHSAGHKKLFMEAWDRLISKASASSFIAKALGKVVPDHALLASFLSEIGTLAVLSAFKSRDQIPTREVYV
ncbi:MAG: HDOD domain-containing protein, partial [Moraxellaceae bacterium]